MSKIDIGLRAGNIFFFPYEVSSITKPATDLFDNWNTSLTRGWYKGALLQADPASPSDPAARDLPNYMVDPIHTGFAQRYDGLGTGPDTFVAQPYPYHPNTTYRVSVWYKLISATSPSLLDTGSAINVVRGPDCSRSVLKFSSIPSFASGQWTRYQLSWTTPGSLLSCPYKSVFLCENIPTGLSIRVWGAELFVVNPNESFYSAWPATRGRLYY